MDWTTDLDGRRAGAAVGGRTALQGNLDPSALFASPDTVRAEALRVLASYGAGPGHVFNLGHGITPDVDPDRVAVLVDTVRSHRPCGPQGVDPKEEAPFLSTAALAYRPVWVGDYVQATAADRSRAAARPVLIRWPQGGRRNI